MPSLAPSRGFLYFEFVSLLFNWSCTLVALTTQVLAYCVPPLKAALSSLRAQHPQAPFLQWLFVLALHPTLAASDHRQLCQPRAAQAAREGLLKLRPRIKLPELAISPSRPSSLGATQLPVSRESQTPPHLYPPQLWLHHWLPWNVKEKTRAKYPTPLLETFLHDQWASSPNRYELQTCSGSY